MNKDLSRILVFSADDSDHDEARGSTKRVGQKIFINLIEN